MTTRTELIEAAADMLEADDAAFKPDWASYRQGKEDGKAQLDQLQATARLALDSLEISKPEHPNCTTSRRTYNKAVTALKKVIE
jgi:hypothetical protein